MILESARKMISKYTLCDCCLGRQYGGLARGVTNRERGRAVKLVLAMEGHMESKRVGADGTGTVNAAVNGNDGGNVDGSGNGNGNGNEKEEGERLLRALATRGGFQPAANVLGCACGDSGACYLCGGTLDRVREYAEGAAKALEGYGFGNFLVGVRVAGEVAEREDALKTEFAIEFGESLKMEASREIGKEISKILHKDVEFERPDVVVTVELPGPAFEVRSMPLFIAGRYRKLVRGIPQSKWDCVHCGGKGCEVCHGTGKIYPISVEEIITGPVIAATGGAGAKFHGAGREDVDAIMRGNGRPFVVEVKEAKVRAVDLQAVEAAVNASGGGKVEVVGLKYSDKKRVRSLKEKAKVAEKVYRALVELGCTVPEEALRKLEKSFKGGVINQLTPNRVLHRRADKLRLKKVHEMTARAVGDRMIELVVRCQGGLYVKELISGDEGRTKPCVADVVGCSARCVELDVIAVNEGA